MIELIKIKTKKINVRNYSYPVFQILSNEKKRKLPDGNVVLFRFV